MGFGILIFKHSRMTFFLSLLLLLVCEAIWRSNSGSNTLENGYFPSRNKENHSQPTQSSLEDSVTPTKAVKTTGKGIVKGRNLDSRGLILGADAWGRGVKKNT